MPEVLRAELAASVLRVEVEPGDQVAAGTTVMILESMKMEIPVVTQAAGTVRSIVGQGNAVDEGDMLAEIV